MVKYIGAISEGDIVTMIDLDSNNSYVFCVMAFYSYYMYYVLDDIPKVSL